LIDFTGQVAVVTGAGRGLGRLYATELARRGASVVVNDLGGSMGGEGSDATVADEVVAEITGAGGAAVASHDSVDSPEHGSRFDLRRGVRGWPATGYNALTFDLTLCPRRATARGGRRLW
jgi:NAD(P)-dependent dehydrogenase (short-subunit alcohol dehydrogenase family)